MTGSPAGTTVTLTLNGPGGTFTVAADGAGNYSVERSARRRLPAIGSVGRHAPAPRPPAQKFGTVTVTGDSLGELRVLQLDASVGSANPNPPDRPALP